MKLDWRGVNVLFLACTAVQFTAEGHINAFTPLLLHDLGLNEAEVAVWTGLLYSIMTATALPLAPFWGVLAERFTRRPIILRSYLCLAGALLLGAWAPDVPWLVASRLLLGFSFGTFGVIIATQVLITPRAKVGSAIAMVQAAQPIAASLGPPLGALAIPSIGLRTLFVVDATTMAVAALAILLLMPEPAERQNKGSVLGRTAEALGLVWTIEPVRWNFISAFMLRGATSVVDAYLPLRITQLAGADAPSTIGWVLGTYGAATTLATWVCSRVVDRVDEIKLYTRTMLFGSLVSGGLVLATWLPLLTVLAVLRSIPVAFSNTLLHTHSARVIPPEHQMPLFGLAQMPRNVGSMSFPLVASLIASLAPTAPLALAALGYFGTSLAGVRLGTVTRRFLRDRGHSS